MKRTSSSVKFLMQRMSSVIGAAALVAGILNTASATQTVRELWDGSGKTTLAGHGSDVSSVGLDSNTTWVVSPAGQTAISWDSSWNLDGWLGIDENTVLANSAGSGGTFAYYPNGSNMNTLTNPATGLPYGNYYSQCYATRALATNAYINFKADGTYYFSVRMFRGYSGWSWISDQAEGIGFASSGATNADFVGMGITRSSPFYSSDGSTDIGYSCYVTAGTLNQPGTGYNLDPTTGLDTDGGPYYPRAAGAAYLFTDQAALLVGQLTTTASGASTMSVKVFPSGTTDYPTDPSTITWDATYSFTETNDMKQLLVWAYGGGTGVQDALRVGTTWTDVMELELTGAIQASPANTVYAGTSVTLSQSAGLNSSTYPMSFQWYSNSVAVVDATNSSLALTNPTVDFTADYTIAVSNYFGMLTNSPIHVTVNAGVKPFFTKQPAPAKAYVGGTATFTVGVDGTPPFTLQLTHAGTNIPGVTASLSGPGTATLKAGPLTVADVADSFSVTATNQFGSSNSQNATVTLVVPSAGSFEEAALTNGAAALWKLSETTNDMTANGVVLKEYMSGLNGLVPNEPGTSSMSNVVFGAAGPGPVLSGFSGITSLLTPNAGGLNAQVNLPTVLYSNQMTMVLWMKALGGLSSDGIMFDRNKDSGTNFYGINNYNGSLGARWGGDDSQWNSGITLPSDQWIMVALVVEPNETTLYAGTDPFTLQSVTRSSVEGVNYTNSNGILPNGRLVIGRSDYSWAIDNNAWGYVRGQYCDAAIFYKSLSPAAISNLFVAGFGTGARIVGKSDGAGNMNLDWYPNVGLILQEAGTVAGPYTDVLDTNFLNVVPPYSEPMTNSQTYYRLRQ